LLAAGGLQREKKLLQNIFKGERKMIKKIVLVSLAITILTLPAKGKKGNIAEHVYGIEIAHGRDYQFPAEDLIYECTFRVQSDASVDRVEFLTPAGNTFEITKNTVQWPNGKTSYEYDGETAHWMYWAYYSDESGLEYYGDGTYTITVFYEGGGQDQTTAWFGIPRTDDYIPLTTQKPISIFPLHGDTTTSRVTFEWEPCEDPSANLIVLQLENLDTGEEINKWFQPRKNSWKNVRLSAGLWDADLSFGQRYRPVRNNDHILVRVSKYSEIDYMFTIDE